MQVFVQIGAHARVLAEIIHVLAGRLVVVWDSVFGVSVVFEFALNFPDADEEVDDDERDDDADELGGIVDQFGNVWENNDGDWDGE